MLPAGSRAKVGGHSGAEGSLWGGGVLAHLVPALLSDSPGRSFLCEDFSSLLAAGGLASPGRRAGDGAVL